MRSLDRGEDYGRNVLLEVGFIGLPGRRFLILEKNGVGVCKYSLGVYKLKLVKNEPLALCMAPVRAGCGSGLIPNAYRFQ